MNQAASIQTPQIPPAASGSILNQPLQVTDLSWSVQGRTILDRIELSLTSGELLVVIGCNGAGKSTLLKHITGELASRRSVQLFGKDLNEHKPRDLARRRAVLAQQTSLTFAYEVEEVVLLGRIPHGSGRGEQPEDYEIARACLRRVGLEEYANRNYLTLSGGEQQRVQFARVLAQLVGTEGERLLFLDEPTSSLDIAYQHLVLKIARDLCTENVGVLAVLHDLNLTAQYADQVLVLADGRVLAFGRPFDVLQADVLEQAFGHEVMVMQHPCFDCPLIVSAI